ncbi:MAG: choice-of-anchor I family protein [Rhodovarius sp.]|nr:choice-of-anchor I family protein [Rhodovarius sp.]
MSASIIGTPLFSVNHTTLSGGAAGSSEVVAFDPLRGLIFVAGPQGVDALNAATGALAFSIPRTAVQVPGGGGQASLGNANSVAVFGNDLAIAFDGPTPGSNGLVAVFTINAAGTGATWRASAEVGAVPDMITFTVDGSRLLVAIEGEPAPGYTVDPPGGLAIIDTATWTPTFYGFGAFDAQAAALRAAGVRLSNAIPGSPQANQALPSLDLEPEYIAISPDGRTAFVTLQENNAIGVFNLDPGAGPIGWSTIIPLGYASHNQSGNGIDTSDRDGGPIIRQVPIMGLYQPDGIAAFQANGRLYLVTANEGDARDYGGAFVEEVRISQLVPATGSTPPAGMPALDPALLAAIQPRRGDADLGRLTVTRWSGDTDGDGDLDQLEVFGARSFTVWEVQGSGAATTLIPVFHSGQRIDSLLASRFPALYDDTRSDNKGAEPEDITLGTIDGVLHVFVGLERANATMAFRLDNPANPTFAGLIRREGDVAPEVSIFIPGSGANPPRLVVANEVSGTTTSFALQSAPPATYTLQILHGSDFEAGLLATGRADRFAAIVDALEDLLPNSITLSAGDNFIPGPFGAAGTDPSVVPVLRAFYAQQLGTTASALSSLHGTSATFFAADIAMLNAIGIQASVLGNHEFDLGTNALAAAIDFTANTTGATPAARVTGVGAQFPYLSANLDFSADPNLRALFTTTLREASTYASRPADLAGNQEVANEAADAQISPWTTIVEGGEVIGILGVTTQVLNAISSAFPTVVADPAGDGGVNNMAELASILQPLIDQMTAQGINKIILLSHLQQYQFELQLATLLRGVDVILAGGSHAVFADGTDVLRPGDVAREAYPVFRTGLDGRPVAIVSTGSEYSYVGRLVLTFDAEGVLVPDPDGAGPLGIGAVDPAVSGAIATTDANVAALWGSANPYAPGTRGGEVRAITDAVGAVITAKDGNVQGLTKTFLEGRRGEVRTEETNLGNLSADANLFVANQFAAARGEAPVLVSHKNGGGIRAEIGAVFGQPVPSELPPLANPAAGKPAGGVSQLDIENSLRFNNALTVLSVTAAGLKVILEHSVAASGGAATPGQFGQWGGLAFSWNPAGTAQVLTGSGSSVSVATPGSRIVNAAILNEDGSVRDVLVQNGALVGDPNRPIKMVTLNFLANGGDSYPFPALALPGSRVDLLNSADLPAGQATFAARGSEQDALAEYLRAFHTDAARAFGLPDTGPAGDLRVINLALRSDAVFQTPASGLAGTPGSDLIEGSSGHDTILASFGRDTIRAGAGFDQVIFEGIGRGNGGFTFNAQGQINGFGWAFGPQQGMTFVSGVERLLFVDGKVEFAAALPGPQVGMLYRAVLGRDADPRGQAFWTEALEAGMPLRNVAQLMLLSPEGQAAQAGVSLSAYIQGLYQTVLGRAASSAEQAFWTGVANAQPTAAAGRAAVADGVIRSVEAAGDPTGFAARGVITPDYEMGWITWTYNRLLGRDPELGGLRFWHDAMEAGLTERAMTAGVVNSTEFQGRFGALGHRDFVEQMYLNILGRSSDPGGAEFYTNALQAGQFSRADVAYFMLSSQEALPGLQQATAFGVGLDPLL